jgi:hypothetical protein
MLQYILYSKMLQILLLLTARIYPSSFVDQTGMTHVNTVTSSQAIKFTWPGNRIHMARIIKNS